MRHLRLAIVLLAVLGFASPAAAQGWGRGWFEKLSGPGPFYGTDVRLAVGCVSDSQQGFDLPWKGKAASTKALLCIDAEFSSYTNGDNDRSKHGFISFDRYQFLAMYIVPKEEFRGAVELGAGVGWTTFHGDSFEFDRMYVPLRAVWKPFRIFSGSRGGASGIFQVVGNVLFFPEAIRHENFNIVPAGEEDRFSHHFRPNVVLVLDFRRSCSIADRIPMGGPS